MKINNNQNIKQSEELKSNQAKRFMQRVREGDLQLSVYQEPAWEALLILSITGTKIRLKQKEQKGERMKQKHGSEWKKIEKWEGTDLCVVLCSTSNRKY